VSLQQLQSQFQDYLLSGESEKALAFTLPDQRFSADRRLKVYYDAYRLRLLEILTNDFSKTHTLLGDENFEKAFFAYLEKHPSHTFSVRYFGKDFSYFLINTLPFKNYPVFSEMAQFEWAIYYTMDALDAPVVTQASLSELPPEKWADLVITFHPSLISHVFAWDTPQLWQDIESEKDPRTPELQAVPTRWLFWRKGIRSFFQSCPPVEEKIFLSLQAGESFSKTCEILLEVLPEEEIPPAVATTLFKWVKEEMVSRFVTA